MAFQSFSFLGFFLLAAPILIGVNRINPRWGRLGLLAASVLFCLLGDATGFPVLVVGTLVSYVTTRRMGKRGFTLGVCYHVAVLFAFKYAAFVTGGAVTMPFVPVGLSFFTFSQIWYLKAVYDRNESPAKLAELSLYSCFFPTVVSGPILSPKDLFPQLKTQGFLRPTSEDFACGLYAFGCGFVKKVLFADQLALVVAKGYAAPQTLSLVGAWLVILGFTLQLYLDFSGYCDMATGLARMLGIGLPVNFNSPYRATSIGDFWKRWHITLTSFLRQCVYLPLGGNRKGAWRTYGNILAVFVISGLWHGAGWTFIIWGLLHGCGQIVERLAGHRLPLPKPIAWALTFGFVNVAWVFFRAPSFSVAAAVLKNAVSVAPNVLGGSLLAQSVYTTEVTALSRIYATNLWALLALAGLYGASLLIALWPRNTVAQLSTLQLRWYHGVGLGLVLGWSLLSMGGTATFIYANF